MQIRHLRTPDLDTVLALNNGAVPHVNELSRATLEVIADRAALCGVADTDTGIAGAVVAFHPGVAYESANYRWFAETYEDFLYLDRVVVAPEHRGLGLGRALYNWLWSQASPPRITCEVNEIPPNPGSMAFHRVLGFERIGTLDHPDGKTVALMCCERADSTAVA